ncbi:hypothetical protein KZ473_05130, partial [Glaesserella parasuis]|nr:hypothetical protein [Glaesserella parasuis]MCT8830146.1 hypothetical protein [Glaesserella parasuis]
YVINSIRSKDKTIVMILKKSKILVVDKVVSYPQMIFFDKLFKNRSQDKYRKKESYPQMK